ncbi:unnamed protein product, partial [Natator depressus]
FPSVLHQYLAGGNWVCDFAEALRAGETAQPPSGPWASPVVLIPKKDASIRLCVDYWRLNAITKFDAYPMPRPDELLDKLQGGLLSHYYGSHQGLLASTFRSGCPAEICFYHPSEVIRVPGPTFQPKGDTCHLPAPGGPVTQGDGEFCPGVY